MRRTLGLKVAANHRFGAARAERHPLVVRQQELEAVGGDEMLADVEDGDDSNRDAFTDSPDEPAKKKQTRRSTRA